MDNQFISQSFDGVKAPVICSAATINSILGESAQSRFNIPIYQRLYAWTPKEIEKMLDDFCDSLPFGRDYYIGNITLNLNPATKNFDIIDGQQRLTTLWLIGLVMSLTGQSAWHSFLSDQKGPSLTFTARPQDVRYLPHR